VRFQEYLSYTTLTGYGRTLQKELTPFGIQTVTFDIGFVRTKLSSQPKVSVPEIDDYKGIFEGFLEASATIPGNEPGNPKKCADRIVDVMKGEGMASGKPMPSQIPLGSDALVAIKETCEGWKDPIDSTDFDGHKQRFWAKHDTDLAW
jgi:hypothetical protein